MVRGPGVRKKPFCNRVAHYKYLLTSCLALFNSFVKFNNNECILNVNKLHLYNHI